MINETNLFKEALMMGDAEMVRVYLRRDSNVILYHKCRPIHIACTKGHTDIVKLLIEMKFDTECEDENGRKPIHIACENGQIDIVKLLIEIQCDIECKDKDGKRPIHIACAKGYTNIVKLLIENNCNIESKNNNKKRMKYLTLNNGHVDPVNLLNNTIRDRKHEGYFGRRSIHYACENGHFDIVKLLFEMKCDMECEDEDKVRPIHLACENKHIDIVKLLIENKCYLECEDDIIRRPIHLACENGDINIVKLLIEMKCDIECKGYYQMRPIHFACEMGYIDIVKLLILNKCKLEYEDDFGRRPIHIACKKGLTEIVKLLIEMKCDIECEDKLKRRPIHFACENGHFDIVKLLIEEKCNMKYEDKWELGLMPKACISGNVELVKLLIDQNYDIECEGQMKFRPIHFACMYGRIEVVKLLIEHKCDIQCKDSSNHTPIYKACVRGHHDIVELLREKTSDVESEKTRRDIITKNMGLTCRMDCDHTGFCRESFLTCLEKEINMTKIGEGAFGNVYKLTESVTNRQFVLKSIKIDADPKADTKVIKSDPKSVKNIENYINICLHSLQHENIVTFFGAIKIDNILYIFMEYMEGGSLKDYIDENKSERLSKWKDYCKTIIEITKQILQAVSFLHRNSIIHRDIKPDNILLDRTKKTVKLSDFGLSRYCVDQRFDILGDLSPDLWDKTFIGEIMPSATSYGTPGYIAPEIRKNEKYTLSADIWSVGATLYHMLEGKKPPNFSYVLKKIKEPKALYQLMIKMVNIEQNDRPSVYELLRETIFSEKEEKPLNHM